MITRRRAPNSTHRLRICARLLCGNGGGFFFPGKNFYSKFTHFISKTILELELDPNTENLMLVTKFYINKSLVSRVKISSGVKLIGYTNKMSNFPNVVSELKVKFANISTWDSTSIRRLVNAFNKIGNRQIISEITKCVASITHLNKPTSATRFISERVDTELRGSGRRIYRERAGGESLVLVLLLRLGEYS